MSDSLIFAFDLSWLNTGYAVFACYDGCDPEMIGSGSFSAPPTHGKKVQLRDQLNRAALLHEKLVEIIKPIVGAHLDMDAHIGYETPKAWALAKLKARAGTSNASILSFGYAEATMWLSVQEVLFSFGQEFSMYELDPNRWHAILEGLTVPRADYEEIKRSYKGELKDIKLKAMMFCKVIHGFIPKTDHEADAVCMGTYLVDILRQERAGV